MISCPRCQGTGLIPTPREIAQQLRALPHEGGVSQVELARRLKITGGPVGRVRFGVPEPAAETPPPAAVVESFPVHRTVEGADERSDRV
jgi:hypothetical protein